VEMERRDGIWNEYRPAGNEAPNAYYLACARQRIELARRTLEFVERSASRPEMAAELKTLEKRIDRAAKNPTSSAGRDLFAQAVDLRRRIVFSHPALDFDRLLVSKRPPPGLSAPGDNYYGMHNGTGPGLVLLDGWKSDRPRETVLLDGQLPAGCAMHADLSFDGRRVVFAYADHTPPRERWQFFLYSVGTARLLWVGGVVTLLLGIAYAFYTYSHDAQVWPCGLSSTFFSWICCWLFWLAFPLYEQVGIDRYSQDD